MECIDDDVEPAVPAPSTVRPRMKNKGKQAATSVSLEPGRGEENKSVQAVATEASVTHVDADSSTCVVSVAGNSAECYY